ncbi:HlyD family efflux transporter periplasmic adaptor subunit [Pseudochrobactrum sp. HB0163]|uniref:HlyD family efflux transporter periplasmic adaptor subunit n=1 Tax=Pseudochrobactrum sp. HB0163 TaxID=3450708 RepID=UPI003F6DBC84
MKNASKTDDVHSPLYRPEAIAARRDAWLGHPKLLQPIPVVVATGIGVIVIALIVSFLTFGNYTRRVRVHGAVVPSAGMMHVFTPQTGRIISSITAEHGRVQLGDPLFTISTDTTTGLGETELVVKEQLQNRISELEKAIMQRLQLDRVDKQGLSEQESAVQNEIERVKAQIAQSEDYISILQPRVDKYRKLISQGIALERTFETTQQSYMQIRQELESQRRQHVQLIGRLAEIRAKLAGFDASAAITLGELRQRIATLKEQLAQGEARRSILITAPVNGTVAALLTHQGQVVAAGTPLVSVLPEGEKMEIHLLAESSAIGFIREGVSVLLRYTAFPYQKFGQYGGKVTKVSRVTLRQNEADIDALAAQPKQTPALYRITVMPDQPHVMAYGKAEALRSGMGVEADLLLDTRPLYQWILEPLYSLRGRVSGQSADTPS